MVLVCLPSLRVYFCMLLRFLTENAYMAQHRWLRLSWIFLSGLPFIGTSRQVYLFYRDSHGYKGCECDTLARLEKRGSFTCPVYSIDTHEVPWPPSGWNSASLLDRRGTLKSVLDLFKGSTNSNPDPWTSNPKSYRWATSAYSIVNCKTMLHVQLRMNSQGVNTFLCHYMWRHLGKPGFWRDKNNRLLSDAARFALRTIRARIFICKKYFSHVRHKLKTINE